jgi:hypothetical protein
MSRTPILTTTHTKNTTTSFSEENTKEQNNVFYIISYISFILLFRKPKALPIGDPQGFECQKVTSFYQKVTSFLQHKTLIMEED